MPSDFTRRSFLTNTALALAAVPAASLLAPSVFAGSGGGRYLNGPCRVATRSAVLAAPTEPGERLIVRGQVFRPDGTTPASNVIAYAYQTGADGVYNSQRGAPPRLRGWMRTDQQGGYEFHTIKPGSYPRSTQSAHIHFQFWGEDLAPQWNNALLFEGDPFLTEQERRESAALGRFGYIKRPEKDASGALLATIDFRLKPGSGDSFEDNTRHGLEPCR